MWAISVFCFISYRYLISACPAAMGVKILVMGDSFIANFKEFLKKNWEEYSISLNLHLREVMIQYSSKRGGTVQKLQTHQLQDVTDFEPDIVFLQIGSNDLCDEPIHQKVLPGL